jgi:sugar lactone lactonase YvrE
MRIHRWKFWSLMLVVLAACAVAQQKGGEDETGPYEVVPNWPQPLYSDGWSWGSIAGIWAESPDRVFVYGRGELPAAKGMPGTNALPTRPPATGGKPRWQNCLMVFDRNGKLVESWRQHDDKFIRPHRVTINPYDPERHIWLVDDGAHQIFKFTNDGSKLAMVLGEKGKPGNDAYHFNRPTDVAFLPNGDFYVSDGYVNTRVAKYNKDGKFLFEWGKPGKGPSEFNLVHSIAIDVDQRRVYVSDRTNSRIQIFDLTGRYLDEWNDIRSPFYVAMTKDGHVAVSDGMTQKILKYDSGGRLLHGWGTFGAYPGQLWGVHQMSVDSEGNLYVAEVFNGRPQKFRPKPGADRRLLIGQIVHSLSR